MTDHATSSTLRFSRSEIVSILSGLMLAMFLASLDQTIVATSLSAMAQQLQGWALMSWVVTAYLVASTITTPIYGRLSDMYGRRPVLLAAIGLFVGAHSAGARRRRAALGVASGDRRCNPTARAR